MPRLLSQMSMVLTAPKISAAARQHFLRFFSVR